MPAAALSGTLLTTLQTRWNAELADQLLDLGPLGCETVSTWLQRVRSSTRATQDVLLHALLSATRDGEVVAVEVLLQALVPAVRRATAGLRSLDDFTPADRAGAAVAAAWEAIRCYRLERDTHVFITLLRDARRVLAPPPTANQRHIADKTVTVDAADLADLAGPQPAPTVPAEVRLAAVLSWARQARILTTTEIDLLIRVTVRGEPVTEIATGLGITVGGVRRRVERTQARLTAAVQAQH